MTRRSRSSAALSSSASSTPNSQSTVTEAGEQTLTPATSLSETSSNADGNGNGNGEKEKEQQRRSSRRVTRSSWVTLEISDEVGEDKDGRDGEGDGVAVGTVSGETFVEGRAATARSSRSRRRVAAMSETTEGEKRVTRRKSQLDLAANTTVQLEASQQQDEGEVGEDEPNASAAKKQEESDGRDASKHSKSSENNRRRSTRINLLEKATGLLSKASSVLGKRSREVMENGKGKGKTKAPDRRASLRPRHSIATPAPASTTSVPVAEAPAAKKRRMSDSAVPSKPEPQEPPAPKPKATQYPRKKWLSQGLYAGQERYSDARLNDAKNRIKYGEKNAKERGKLLPLPMFAGQRLIENGRDFKLPFDIFCPLPPGQPKPNEWRKTNKNVFVDDAADIWKATKLTELSTCLCTPETGCDDNCQNRYMFYECDDSNCKLSEEQCGNRSFNALRRRTKAGGKYNIGVEVIKTEDRGYGVRSNRTFQPNQIIVEYTGEIITQFECEKRMRTTYKDNECYYLMYFDQNMIIDATNRGSIARFVNHSCEPNCRMEKWTVAGKPRVALFAEEGGIMTGDELTYDYNFDPYSQKNVQECRCGAPTCRGILGPRPKDANRSRDTKDKDKQTASAKPQPKKKTNSAKSVLAGTKRRVENVLDDSTSRLNKKRRTLQRSQLAKGTVKKARASPTARAASSRSKSDSTETNNKARKEVRPRAAPIKKTKVKPRLKTTASSKKASATANKSPASSPARTKTQSTKLNRPSKAGIRNSIATARTADKTPAAMRRFLEAGKKLSDANAKATQSASSKTKSAEGKSAARSGKRTLAKAVRDIVQTTARGGRRKAN